MTTLTNRSLTTALRILCSAGALTACSAWASVVNWQLAAGTSNDLSRAGYTNTVQGIGNSADASNQLSFKSAPESGATVETSAIRAAALNDKLQARDTDFQHQAPSTISNLHAQPSAAFNEQFVTVSNYQFASVAPASAGATATSADGNVVPVPEMSALFPIVGLIVAVSCTRILRRRRAAQLSAARILV